MNTYIYKLLYNNLPLHLIKYASSLVWIISLFLNLIHNNMLAFSQIKFNKFFCFYPLQYLHIIIRTLS